MTPLFFFILCLNSGGAQDCNYEWDILPLDEVQGLYGIEGNIGGFQRGNHIYAVNLKILIHEVGHLECIINQSDPTELQLCHFGIDTEYLVQGVRPYHGWGGITDNSPPEIREKDAFRELLYSNKEYGT